MVKEKNSQLEEWKREREKKCVTVITFCTKESMKSGRIGLASRILGAAH